MNDYRFSNEAPSSKWMGIKKTLIVITIFTSVITLMVTGGRFFNYISALGHYHENAKLYDLLKAVALTVISFWLLNKALLMGGVDKAAKNMRIDKFFSPEEVDQVTLAARGGYFGVDFKTGVIGVASAYKTKEYDKKIIYLECNVIDSYDWNNHNLILNLRCNKLPTLTIPVKDGKRMFRKIEQLSNQAHIYSESRGSECYQANKNKLIKAGKMIEADY